MKFARKAKWLTELFTPSVTPPTRFPDDYSHDVSLIQPYDGGGFGIPEPQEWGTSVNSAVGASATTTLETALEREIVRVFAVSVALIAGVAAECHLHVLIPGRNVLPSVAPKIAVPTPTSEGFALPGTFVCIGPGHVLQGIHTGGGAATQIQWNTYAIHLPLGTVPR